MLPLDMFGVYSNNIKNATNKNKKEANKIVLNYLAKIMPSGLEFQINLEDKKPIICDIKEEHLNVNINNMSKNYKSKAFGKWTTIGILNSVPKQQIKSSGPINNLNKSIDQVEDIVLNFLNSEFENKFVIKPIIIYRTLTY